MKGLSSDEARLLLEEYGPNKLPEPDPPGLGQIILGQFRSPFIYVLFAASVVSLILGQYVNCGFIFAVLILNALIGTFQEYSAERAAQALKDMVPGWSMVIRDGRTRKVLTAEIVPGDLVSLASGDKVPADIHLISGQGLELDESMLTGESVAARKEAGPEDSADRPLADRPHTVFAGTVVNRGRGEGRVLSTGSRTEIGHIAQAVASPETVKPPLLQRVEKFTLWITYSMLLVILLLFVITLIRNEPLGTVFLLAVALAVSAIPEGLPAAMTVALSIGMRRMAKASVIVRRLVAVESLGSCTFIASDKTGTLTVNEMTIRTVVLADGRRWQVTGEGVDLHGAIQPAREEADLPPELEDLCLAGVLANEAKLEKDGDGWEPTGDMVDVAFLVLAHKYGLIPEETRSRYPEIAAIPYESENGFSASVHQCGERILLFAKGSSERILSMCDPATGPSAAAVNARVDALADDGFRVLALAMADLSQLSLKEAGNPQNCLHHMTMLGLVGMIDPLRPDAAPAVAACHRARIQVAMITGDHPRTAVAISRDLGIAGRDSKAVTGAELSRAAAAGEEELDRLVSSSTVFARVEPAQKRQIVDSLIRHGQFVAVTGDGVNDAPALRHAHVGVAMGERGTDVARESADLILTDDCFSSIVGGIKQGRLVYNNIRKVIFLLISTGAAEVFLFVLSLIFALPMPLYPLQLLWLNLVTNGLQDVALAFEPEEGHELEAPPRPPGEPIFNRLMIERVVINALVMGSIAFALYAWLLGQGMDVASARNLVLLQMVLFENVHVFNSRSEKISIFRQNFFGNPLLLGGMLGAQALHIGSMFTPGLRDVLQVQPVSLQQWGTLLGFASVLILVDELHKLWHGRFGGERSAAKHA